MTTARSQHRASSMRDPEDFSLARLEQMNEEFSALVCSANVRAQQFQTFAVYESHKDRSARGYRI